MDIVFRVIVHQLLAVALEALRRAVFQHAAVNRFQHVKALLRCGKVGLAYVEVKHVDAAFFGSVGKRGELADRGSGHGYAAVADLRHCFMTLNV